MALTQDQLNSYRCAFEAGAYTATDAQIIARALFKHIDTIEAERKRDKAQALRDAARAFDEADLTGDSFPAHWLRARADELEAE